MRIYPNMLSELRAAIDHQANMESLWLMHPTVTEAMLMAALRHLHAIVEGEASSAEKAKKIYWDLESELLGPVPPTEEE